MLVLVQSLKSQVSPILPFLQYKNVLTTNTTFT